jgi:hypothetical protein
MLRPVSTLEWPNKLALAEPPQRGPVVEENTHGSSCSIRIRDGHVQGVANDMSGTPHIEHIRDAQHVLAIILRAEYEPDSIEFLTTNEQSLQLGVMRRPRGHVIAPHIHKPVLRTVQSTYEALFIARGRVEVTFFNEGHDVVVKRELRQGDCVMLMAGGHGFRVLEDCKMIEVKQGPYSGTDFDKFRLE